MWSLLAGLLLKLPGIANGVVEVLNKRSDTDLARHQTDVAADVATNPVAFQAWLQAQHDVAAARQADRASLLTAWMVPTAFALALTHAGAVFLDSVPLFGHVVGSWRVAALPADYVELQRLIIQSGVGLLALKGVTRAFSR